jgi:Domain of unknown function (DUF4190)
MYPGDSPFDPPTAGPFPAQAAPTVLHGGGSGPSDYNTFALLSPIFAVIFPPAGVALAHLAVSQIRRTGERGRRAAIVGMVLGYLMCGVALVALIWWLTGGSGSEARTSSSPWSAAPYQVPPIPSGPSTVTSVAPAAPARRFKVDLATVPIGTCVEIQLRSDEGNEALDLFKVDCEHKEGVYTVSDRVSHDFECRSVYIAAPPDDSFALCLNPYSRP